MIIQIIDALLYVLIYGSMILFPALFVIHMQIAWENHIDSYFIPKPKVANHTTEKNFNITKKEAKKSKPLKTNFANSINQSVKLTSYSA